MFFLDVSSIWNIFDWKSWFHIWKLSRNKVGHPWNFFEYYCDLKTTIKSQILDFKIELSILESHHFFYFSSITPFFLPKFSNPYCRTSSYGPYGPFWFSAKSRRDWVKRYQNEDCVGNVNFSFYRENEFILWR